MPLISRETIDTINSMPDMVKALQSAFGADKTKKGFVCPVCNNGAGRDGDGVTRVPKSSVWKCFKCGEAHPPLKWLTMNSSDRNFTDIVKGICQEYNITPSYEALEAPRSVSTSQNTYLYQNSDTNAQREPQTFSEPLENNISTEPDNTDYFKHCRDSLKNTDYWQKRGLSEAVCQRHWIGYDTGKNALVIPNTKSSYLLRYVKKATDAKGKVWNPPGIQIQLFNSKALYTADKPVFIVEGAIDAMSIEEAGGAAVGLNSTSNIRILLDEVKKCRPKTLLIIAMDNDNAGKAAAEKLKTALDEIGVDSMIYNPAGDMYKDANDRLIYQPDELRAEVSRSLEEWQDMKLWSSSNAGQLDDIFAEFMAEREYYSTGFSGLDAILDGGLYTGLYFIGAISSLGKTAFLLQMADQLAKDGHHVLYFSLEMSKKDLVARSLSRISAEVIENDKTIQCKPLTTRQILSRYNYMKDIELLVLDYTKMTYSQYAKNIFMYAKVGDISINDIEKITANHIRQTGKKPVVMIDYLQILTPVLEHGTDKQEIDQAVKRLKLLAENNDVPVLAISSFNRANYTEPVNMSAFKESGAVEYSSDVLIGLQYEFMEYKTIDKEKNGKAVEARETEADRAARIKESVSNAYADAEHGKPVIVECKVLKNRNGRKGSCYFKNYQKYNRFVSDNFRDMGNVVKIADNPFKSPAPKKTVKTADSYIGETKQGKDNTIWKGVKKGSRIYMQNEITGELVALKTWQADFELPAEQ